jgi:hypothetical protein
MLGLVGGFLMMERRDVPDVVVGAGAKEILRL